MDRGRHLRYFVSDYVSELSSDNSFTFFIFGLHTDTGSISGFGRAGWKSCCILNERKSAYCFATAAGSQCNR